MKLTKYRILHRKAFDNMYCAQVRHWWSGWRTISCHFSLHEAFQALDEYRYPPKPPRNEVLVEY